MKAAVAFVFCLIAIAGGEDYSVKVESLLVEGREYEDATVIVENRLAAKVVHSSGIKRVATAQLPEDLQKRLGLIPDLQSVPTLTENLMRNIPRDSPKFKEVFEAWLKTKAGPRSRITVSQDVGAIKLCTLDLSDDTVALIGDFQERADGSVFEAQVIDTGRFYDYTTVLGAPKKVKIFRIAIPSTEADFVSALKQGETFLIPDRPVRSRCGACKGSPIKCAECGSTGIVTAERQIKIKW